MNVKFAKSIAVVLGVTSLTFVPTNGAMAQSTLVRAGALSAADTAGLAACTAYSAMFAFADSFNALPKAQRVATRNTALATLRGYNSTAQSALNTAIRANASYRTWSTAAGTIAGFAATGNGTAAVETAVNTIKANCTALHRRTGR